MATARVFINGQYVGYTKSSRTQQRVDVTRFVQSDRPNLIAIVVCHWPRFLTYVVVLWSATLLVVPGAFWLLNRWGLRRSGLETPSAEAFTRFAPAFVPLGLGLWMAFFVTMLMVNYTFVIMTLAEFARTAAGRRAMGYLP